MEYFFKLDADENLDDNAVVLNLHTIDSIFN